MVDAPQAVRFPAAIRFLARIHAMLTEKKLYFLRNKVKGNVRFTSGVCPGYSATRI